MKRQIPTRCRQLHMLLVVARVGLLVYSVLFLIVLFAGAPWSELPWGLAAGGLIYMGLLHLFTAYHKKRCSKNDDLDASVG